jgi:hypothetical protein
MAKRLSDSDMWNRDWFLNLKNGKYQLFCLYLRDHCDHAGVWNPAFKRFEQSTGFRINPNDYLSMINNDRIRVHVLENGKWWLTGFIEDQYKNGMVLNMNFNPMKGVFNSLRANKVPYESYGYKLRDSESSPTLSESSPRSKDQDQDNVFNYTSISSNNKINKNGNIHSPAALRISKILYQKILETGTTMKPPNLNDWAVEVQKLHDIDKKPWDLINKIMRNALKDLFWNKMLRSTKKLRKHICSGQFDKFMPAEFLTDEEYEVELQKILDAEQNNG